MTYADTSILVCLYAFEDTAEEARKLLSGLLHPVPLNHFLWLEMRNASARFTEKLNTRAFDVLHVAIAIETGCRAFLTFDKDQAKLAKAAGLVIKTGRA